MAPKTGLALAVLEPKPGKGMAEKPEEGEDAEKDSSAEGEEAAQALLDAIEAKDAKGVDMALKAHWMACQEDDDEEESPPSSRRY